jgi:hypothetical protein
LAGWLKDTLQFAIKETASDTRDLIEAWKILVNIWHKVQGVFGTLPKNEQGKTANDLDPNKPTNPRGYNRVPSPTIPRMIRRPDKDALRAEYYGPRFGEHNTDVIWGPGLPGQAGRNKLRFGDIALSPDQLKLYPLGTYVDIVDPTTGQVLRRHRRVADISYKSPGHPNYRTFEIWNDRIKQDRARIRRSQDQTPTSVPITIHNHIENHFHGGEADQHHRLAEAHKRHIDQLKKDLREVIWEQKPSSFNNAAGMA